VHTTFEGTTAWPKPEPSRLAAAVAALAEGVAEADVRAQLHALGAVLANLGAEGRNEVVAQELDRALEAAIGVEDERRALAVLRELTALDRSTVSPVDWSLASGG